MTHHAGVAMAGCQFNSFQGFRESADLVEFDEHAVANFAFNAHRKAGSVGDKQVVPNELNFASKFL